MPSIFHTLLLSSSSPMLTYEEISINDILILRDDETAVRCLDKDEEKSLLYVSYPSNSTKEDQWIDFDRVLKRADRNVQFDEKEASAHLIQSNPLVKPAPIRPYKRRLTKDSPISLKIKLKSPTDNPNSGETSPDKRCRLVGKRNGRRSIGTARGEQNLRSIRSVQRSTSTTAGRNVSKSNKPVQFSRSQYVSNFTFEGKTT